MKEINEIYQEDYVNILAPYITKKISIYALCLPPSAYRIIFQFDIKSLYDLICLLDKSNTSLVKKVFKQKCGDCLFDQLKEVARLYEDEIIQAFYEEYAPKIMEDYDAVRRTLYTLPICLLGENKKMALLQIESLGQLNNTLLNGVKECEIELVEDATLREQYQEIYDMIYQLVRDGHDLEEISHDVMAHYSPTKRKY